ILIKMNEQKEKQKSKRTIYIYYLNGESEYYTESDKVKVHEEKDFLLVLMFREKEDVIVKIPYTSIRKYEFYISKW
ncbi:MAG: hypothetical protein QXS74_09710, partial [Nitrososphaeria archaeon]